PDIDALDIGPRALVDEEQHADCPGLRIAVAARPRLAERITAARQLDRHVFDGFFDRLAVVDLPRRHPQNWTQRLPADGADIGLNVNSAEMVERSLFDGEGYDEAFFTWIVHAGGRHHLHVGIAMFEIEAPDQIAIGFDAVGVIDVGRLQEA